jgi:hypothetical protein
MKVSIQEEDIENGKPGSSNSCPIALRLIKLGLINVQVTRLRIDYQLPGSSFIWSAKISKSAGDRIVLFDCHKIMYPFSFYLKLPK